MCPNSELATVCSSLIIPPPPLVASRAITSQLITCSESPAASEGNTNNKNQEGESWKILSRVIDPCIMMISAYTLKIL